MFFDLIDKIERADEAFSTELRELLTVTQHVLKPFELKNAEKFVADSLSMTQSRIERYERCRRKDSKRKCTAKSSGEKGNGGKSS